MVIQLAEHELRICACIAERHIVNDMLLEGPACGRPDDHIALVVCEISQSPTNLLLCALTKAQAASTYGLRNGLLRCSRALRSACLRHSMSAGSLAMGDGWKRVVDWQRTNKLQHVPTQMHTRMSMHTHEQSTQTHISRHALGTESGTESGKDFCTDFHTNVSRSPAPPIQKI